jgi:membrane-associated HD superfamily phosphohydrolase
MHLFSRLNEQDVQHLLKKDERAFNRTKTTMVNQAERNMVMEDYLHYVRGKALKTKEIELEQSRVKVANEKSVEDSLNELSEKLNNIVFKMNFNFDPVTLSFCDDQNQLINRVNLDVGKLEVLIDEVYSYMHLVKFMGLKIESKKKLKVMGTLVKVC